MSKKIDVNKPIPLSKDKLACMKKHSGIYTVVNPLKPTMGVPIASSGGKLSFMAMDHEAKDEGWANNQLVYGPFGPHADVPLEIDEDDMNYRFESKEEYEEWCKYSVNRIKLGCIAMNDVVIRDVVKDIDSKLYLSDHMEIHP